MFKFRFNYWLQVQFLGYHTSTHDTKLHQYWLQTLSVYAYRNHNIMFNFLGTTQVNRHTINLLCSNSSSGINYWGTTQAIVTSLLVANSVQYKSYPYTKLHHYLLQTRAKLHVLESCVQILVQLLCITHVQVILTLNSIFTYCKPECLTR